MPSTILLVEDDRFLREGLASVLLGEGYRVTAADSFVSALNAMSTQAFDLYILDVMLPDGNGIDLLKALRKTSAAPAMFLTACDDEVSAVSGLDAGGDDYVTKPFRLKELLSRVRALLRRGEDQQQKDVLTLGELQLHMPSQQLNYGGQDVRLTPTEFQLLLKFVRNPGQLLTRSQLLGSLWDDAGEFVDDNNLSVHISHLREKLPGIQLVTMRGLGYRLEVK